MRWLIALSATVLLCPLAVQAQCYTSSYGYGYSYPTYTPTYVQEKVVQTVFAVPFILPAYGAGYVPAQQQQAAAAPATPAKDDAVLKELKNIGASLTGMDKRITDLERRISQPPPVPVPPPVPTPPQPAPQSLQMPRADAPRGFAAVATAKCAQCHTAQTASEGGGFVLLDGGRIRDLAPAEELKMTRKLYAGAMPPANNKYGVPAITDEEMGQWMQWMDERRKQANK